jgi:hypothetical protein
VTRIAAGLLAPLGALLFACGGERPAPAKDGGLLGVPEPPPAPVRPPPPPAPAQAPVALPGGGVIEPCDHRVEERQGPHTSWALYAQHEYTGRSAVELARVRVLGVPRDDADPAAPPGFRYTTLVNVFVRDGAVAVLCGYVAGDGSTLPPSRPLPALREVLFVDR